MISHPPFMNPFASSTPACRHCRYYIPQGRRGGHCQQLNVTVQSGWKACSLSIPPFSPAWENLEEIMRWQHKQQTLADQEAVDPVTVNEVVDPNLIPQLEEVPVVVDPVPAPRPTVGIRALWM